MSIVWRRKNMSKLKRSFKTPGSQKSPVIGADNSSGSISKTPAARDLALKLLAPTIPNPSPRPLDFGTLHTKASSSPSQSGSQWMSLLNSASGGIGSVLGGGLLSSGGFGFIGNLLSLFGGDKSTPSSPIPFQSPVQQQRTLNVGSPGGTSAVSLGVHALNPSSHGNGVYQQNGSSPADQHAQSVQVVQIVKQALLTSSSLNDVISEVS
jgi:hypothetical protein